MTFLPHVIFIWLHVVSFFIPTAQGIAGGTTAQPCDYPGLAAVEIASSGVVTCHGVIQANTLYLPELCSNILVIQSFTSNITVHYGDGSSIFTIPALGLRGSMISGTYRVDVSGIPNTGPCEGSATFLNETQSLDTSSCQVVGYGPSTPSAVSFTGILHAASVIKSTTAGCCAHILETFTEAEQGPLSSTTPKNCLQSTGSTCSVAEIGAPVYCDTTSGEKVVIGLASSIPCSPGSVFTAHDLTDSSDQIKFGIPA